MMYLIMTKEKPNPIVQLEIRRILNVPATEGSYDGESTQTIQSNLQKEDDDCAVITADNRFLKFVGTSFSLENIYIYQDKKLIPLIDVTIRTLRPGHNLMNIYESGEFN